MKQKQIGSIMIFATAFFIVFSVGFMFGLANSGPTPYTAVDDSTTIQAGSESEIAHKININTASADQLTMLDGIGDTLAQRIVDYRTENGPFNEISDIKNVSGIGDVKFEQISEYITTGG